ncbi:hypothetical protein [Thaumasiovibrio sp. DFM-14]|uniref:hypothetical protein n=1 Tax=Thaumasiovibrio sp. DFM-14 TaxID=3384792 RepID=UPI0039A3F7B0
MVRILILIGVMIPTLAWGLEISPLVSELNLDKKQQYQIRVSNNDSQPVTISTLVKQLQFDDQSYALAEESSDHIDTVPAAFTLEPGGSRQVLVIAHPTEHQQSQSYAIVFSNELLDSQSVDSSITMQVNYNAILHTYKNTHNATISDATLPVTASNNQWQFSVTNQGNRYSQLSNYDLELISSSGERLILASDAIKADGLDVFFPPKQKRDVTLNSTTIPLSDIVQVRLLK